VPGIAVSVKRTWVSAEVCISLWDSDDDESGSLQPNFMEKLTFAASLLLRESKRVFLSDCLVMGYAAGPSL
jgi:hypothetical protein